MIDCVSPVWRLAFGALCMVSDDVFCEGCGVARVLGIWCLVRLVRGAWCSVRGVTVWLHGDLNRSDSEGKWQ